METKKEEINNLRAEESELEQKVDAGQNQLDQLLRSLQDAQAQIEQVLLVLDSIDFVERGASVAQW